MKFIENIPRFVDAQDFYKAVYPDFKENGGFSLARVCERVMDKKLCKKEQMSNWENRPLRFSQEHYGAMDAWILGQIIVKLIAKGKKGQFDKMISAIGEKADKNAPKERAQSKKKEKREPAPKEERKAKEADPSKIKDYERQIEYHTKKLEEFKELLKKAKEMETQKK